MQGHKERAHSMFSASGSERWLNCAASVGLEELAPPSRDTPWSKEGTFAHEVHEALLLGRPTPKGVSLEMLGHVGRSVQKIKAIHRVFGGKLLVEKRVHASFIHPDMFGTCDVIIAGAALNNVRTLHILDFKYGAGHIVEASGNTQLIQYSLSVAESYGWEENFDEVSMWILQPRAGDNWYKRWTITIKELRGTWLPLWEKGVKRVLKAKSAAPFPGSWCHWCRAKNFNCPAKMSTRTRDITDLFTNTPLTKGGPNGLKKESKKEKESGAKNFAQNKAKGGRKKEGESFY